MNSHEDLGYEHEILWEEIVIETTDESNVNRNKDNEQSEKNKRMKRKNYLRISCA